MNSKQYERWRDFACRMARHAFSSYREANRKRIEGFVRDFFLTEFDGDTRMIEGANSWDQGPDVFVCDLMANFETNGIDVAMRWPGERTEKFIESATDVEFDATYRGCRGEYRLDFWQYRRKSIWCGPVNCCVRAGLDVVAEPSEGVIGFDVGDLRRMYPEGLPDWVATWFKTPITAETPDNMGVWL